MENPVLEEGTDSLEAPVYLASREREVLQEKKATEDRPEWDRRDPEGLQVLQERAEPGPRAPRGLPDPVVLPDAQATLEAVGLQDLLGTATPLSAWVFPTTDRDT